MRTLRVVLVASVAVAAAACSSAPSKPITPTANTPPAAPAANMAGSWTITTETPMGAQETKLSVAQTGKDIKGTMESPQGSVPITGTADGKEFKFGFDFDAQGTSLRIDYIGTVEGPAMKGKAVFGTFGEGTFTGKKNP
jgi:hypothetical protein